MIIKNFSIADYCVFVGLLVASSFIGIFFAWRARNAPSSSSFLTGNRKLSIFPVTMSLVASFMSTNTLLGVPAEVYQVGTQFAMQIFSITLVIILAAEVFMPVYYDLGIVSINEYLLQRFNSKNLKMAGSLGFLIATMPYMAVVLYGPAIALSSVTPVSIPTSILVVGIICTFYTSIGGIKAVIWTDVLQCILMFLGVAIVIIQGLIELGGFTSAINILDQGGRLKLLNFKFNIYNHDNIWNVLMGSSISWGACYCVSQTQVQRYCSMRSKKFAKRTLYYNLPGLICLSIMSILSGVVIYGKYHDCDPVTLGIIKRHDQLVPYYVMDTLAKFPGLPGLFVACVFSGSLSTLSSGFNALAAVTWEDLLKNRFSWADKDDHRSMRAVRLLALGYGLLAIAMSFGVGSLGTVMQASMSLFGSMNGPLFGLFSIAVLCRFVNSKGAMAGFLCGLAVSLSISLGGIVHPRPHISLRTTVDNCSTEIREYYLSPSSANDHFLQMNSRFLTSYHPEGVGKILHISYLIMSVVGFVVCVVVGLSVSLLTGGHRENRKLDQRLLSPIVRNISFVTDVTLDVNSNHHNHNHNNNSNLKVDGSFFNEKNVSQKQLQQQQQQPEQIEMGITNVAFTNDQIINNK
ncbi:sodium-coupled monocarboxylate transporter 1-like protein 2 [Dermatophagoides farinae]|uniref:Sodium-coupled monocarboxylate transporter 1-like protein 2 n=1 Tax=Dermatophagoides farinae TaxID=6954 RepID=A0A9D4SKX6_DERFA|nr:sodium-coupled monocarboxylate transporter 1-like isoform X2 [Dermatophagoides farinae]KAH7644920.1 sodium-coupled monocarboxylate transporter 1-like protein 2 [Dermatophagoides farinae]